MVRPAEDNKGAGLEAGTAPSAPSSAVAARRGAPCGGAPAPVPSMSGPRHFSFAANALTSSTRMSPWHFCFNEQPGQTKTLPLSVRSWPHRRADSRMCRLNKARDWMREQPSPNLKGLAQTDGAWPLPPRPM
eukprot:3669967-Lingulodinium_polyedra.AAC.2